MVESLRRATPDVIKTLSSVTSISRGIIENRDQLANMMSSAAGYLESLTPFVTAQRTNLITVVESTSTILSTVGDNPDGLSATLAEADKFGAAGTVLFSSGKFNITAVATFSQPMPYTAADCPRYGSLRGQQCFGTGTRQGVGPVRIPGTPNGTVLNPPRGDDDPGDTGSPTGTSRQDTTRENSGRANTTREGVIDGTAENKPMSNLESTVTGKPSTTGTPSAATTLMVGPMVRGMKVQVRHR